MNNKVVALIAVVVVVVAGWLVYRNNATDIDLTVPYGSGDQGGPAATNPAPVAPTTGTTVTTVTSVSTTSTVKEFTVSGGNFYFAPKTLTVNKGDTVKINFVNAGGTHDFKIDEFNVATPMIQTGQTASVTFVASKTGTFEYYCSMGTHRQMGMKGTLTVN